MGPMHGKILRSFEAVSKMLKAYPCTWKNFQTVYRTSLKIRKQQKRVQNDPKPPKNVENVFTLSLHLKNLLYFIKESQWKL